MNGFKNVIGRLEVEDLGIERQYLVEPFRREHGVAHAERAGAVAGDRAAGLERIGRGLGAMERFEPVADRIGEHDQVLDPALIRQRPRAARDFHAVLFQMRRERIERRRVGNLPAVERRAFVFVGVDDDALLAVVHAQRQRAAALVDQLHAEKVGAVSRPILEVLGADTDIAQGVEMHRGVS